jgi:heptosyltransferase-1
MSAMGDVIHCLPAVAALAARPGVSITWLVKERWAPLLTGNPHVHEILTSWPSRRFDAAYDFQGLIKSAILARLGSGRVVGFTDPRETPARWFYSETVARRGEHVVDHNLALAGAAGPAQFWLPSGAPEGHLPNGPFVLASPLAGWKSKQWPLEYYRQLEQLLPVPLVLNGPPGSGFAHESSLPGLIDATRRAAAIVGVDSGPLHLAAALQKPGVAIYGPTSPERNGPYGGSMKVLRASGVATSYQRGDEIDASMRAITPEQVAATLKEML